MSLHEDAVPVAEPGLGLGARIVLAFFAGVFGIGMIAMASPETGAKKLFFYAFGAFCLLIATACVTQGRFRQFVGSVIGCVAFLVGIVYLGHELLGGRFLSSGRSGTSVFQAVVFLLVFGVPGASYALSHRFGYWKPIDDPIVGLSKTPASVTASDTDRP